MRLRFARITLPPSNGRAPLRRSMPAGRRSHARLETALLALGGVIIFVDIELALAWLLHVASRLVP